MAESLGFIAELKAVVGDDYVVHAPEDLLQRLRDEAHRFAITFHRERRSKNSIRSALDLVPGIGPKRRKLLITKFGSVKGIQAAELEDIAAVPGMTMKQARTVKEYL